MMELISRNPATGNIIAQYNYMSSTELNTAVERATTAHRLWRCVPVQERTRYLRRFADVFETYRNEAAMLAAVEIGKPIAQGRAEVDKCVWTCRWIADHASAHLSPLPIQSEFHSSHVRFEPLGIILAIMPWNFPFWQVIRAAIPAIAAGNCIVLKHSPEVTGCALLLERVANEAELIPGVFEVIRANHEQVATLITDRRIAAVTLTGSTRAGRIIASRAGEALKKIVLELGGSDPYIVLDDADLANAVETCVQARMINSGQSCIAAKRFIVHQRIREQFEQRFLERIAQYRPDDPLNEHTELGPLARVDLAYTLDRQARESIAQGARVLLEGGPTGIGAYCKPIVLTDVGPGMPAFEEETFGPLAAIIPAKDYEEAIELANRSCYGLGAAIFTCDSERAEHFISHLQAGLVFVNAQVRSDARLPFGGIKDSGWGRELSVFGIREFVNIKTVVVA